MIAIRLATPAPEPTPTPLPPTPTSPPIASPTPAATATATPNPTAAATPIPVPTLVPTEKYQNPGNYLDNVTVDGSPRFVTVHIPPSYQPGVPAPRVINLHGRTSMTFQQEEVSQMNAKADSEGFVAVGPQAAGDPATWWGPIPNELGQPDMDFFEDLLAYLQREISIDPDRIYATGLSNGATLANRLACDMADTLAAIAPVAGGHVAPDRVQTPSPGFSAGHPWHRRRHHSLLWQCEGYAAGAYLGGGLGEALWLRRGAQPGPTLP